MAGSTNTPGASSALTGWISLYRIDIGKYTASLVSVTTETQLRLLSTSPAAGNRTHSANFDSSTGVEKRTERIAHASSQDWGRKLNP